MPRRTAPRRAISTSSRRPSRAPAWSGLGAVHHIAFAVADDDAQDHFRARLIDAGHRVTPRIDRTYFHSIYFGTPGGVLFEIATAGPGFTLDEPRATLGEELKLPRQHEHLRARLEREPAGFAGPVAARLVHRSKQKIHAHLATNAHVLSANHIGAPTGVDISERLCALAAQALRGRAPLRRTRSAAVGGLNQAAVRHGAVGWCARQSRTCKPMAGLPALIRQLRARTLGGRYHASAGAGGRALHVTSAYGWRRKPGRGERAEIGSPGGLARRHS